MATNNARWDGLDSHPAKGKTPPSLRSLKRQLARLKRDVKQETQVSMLLSQVKTLRVELADLKYQNLHFSD